MHSKAVYSQLNLDTALYHNGKINDKKLKSKKSQKYRKQTRSNGVSPREREKSLWGNDIKKIGFKLGVKERGSYG